MELFDFKIVLSVSTLSKVDADQLYAHCKDATLITCEDQTWLDFDREAATLEQAMRSAIADIEDAGFGITRVELEPTALTVR